MRSKIYDILKRNLLIIKLSDEFLIHETTSLMKHSNKLF